MKNISLDWILYVEYLFAGVIVIGWKLKEICGISNIRFRKHQITI